MTHRQIHAMRRRYTIKPWLLVGMVIVLSATSVLAEHQPGELLEVTVAPQKGPLTVRFRYCPSGQLLRGKPKPLPEPTGNKTLDALKRKALLADMRGFYIQESEVSQQQFQDVLGEQAVQTVFQRMVAGETGGRGSEFPIRGVTVFEAAEFCESLRQLDSLTPAASSGLEDRRFRLPTPDEWQYACRAIRDPEQTDDKPHFNAWPAKEDLPKSVLADCMDVWSKKLNEQTPFVGTQDQVMRVIEAHDNPRRGVEILSEFLRLALGTKRGYRDPSTEPQPVRTGKPNAWNVFNAHGNVFEWTIAERDDERLSDVWRALTAGDRQSLTAEDEATFFLAGGSYSSSVSDKVANWITFSTWGGHPMNDGEPAPGSLSELEAQDIVNDMLPGFRVLLERVLASNWLFVIRKSTVLDEKSTLNDISKRLADHRKVVAELATGRDLALAEARIQFYEALAGYDRGGPETGAQLLANVGPTLSEDDSYFRLLQDLVNNDSR